MEVAHIGYAVKNINKAIIDFGYLGFTFDKVINDTDRNILIAFGNNCRYKIELVAPNGKGISPVDNYLEKIGSTAYHICYISTDFYQDIERLKLQGFREILPPSKAIAFSGKRVVFMTKLSVGLLEIVEA